MKIITKLLLVSIIASSALSASPFTAIKQAATHDPYVATSFALSTALIGIGNLCMHLENKNHTTHLKSKKHRVNVKEIKKLLDKTERIREIEVTKNLYSRNHLNKLKALTEAHNKNIDDLNSDNIQQTMATKSAIINFLDNELKPVPSIARDIELIGLTVGLATLTYLGLRTFFTYIQGKI